MIRIHWVTNLKRPVVAAVANAVNRVVKTAVTGRVDFRKVALAAYLSLMFVVVYYGAYWLRFEGEFSPGNWRRFRSTVVWVVLIKLAVFVAFKIFRGWSRFVTFHDLVALSRAVTVSSLAVAICDYVLWPRIGITRSVFLMDWCGSLIAVAGVRAAARVWIERGGIAWIAPQGTPTFIVGVNHWAESLSRAVHCNPDHAYSIRGFISEDENHVGSRIGGVPVVGQLKDLRDLIAQFGIKQVLVASGKVLGKELRTVVDECQQERVGVKVVPSYEELLGSSIAPQPRQVAITDLLRRDAVELDQTQLHEWIDGRVLMITGGAGSIGSEICRQLLNFSPSKLVVVDRSEEGQFYLDRELREIAGNTEIEICIADVRERDRMDQVLSMHRPEIIFHAAAYKHVPLMEQHPGEAVKNIVLLTQQLADLAESHGVESFVMVSTDKAVNPTSVMGACKRVAELYVQSLSARADCRFVTVRFGNVLDSAGSVVPIFRKQIAAGGPVTITHPDMTRFFMTIPEASQLVIQAGAMGNGGEILVLDMGEPVRIVDLAHDMIRLSGLTVGQDIEIEFVGMRPGEKLYEELHVFGERHVETDHPKITVAESRHISRLEVTRGIRRLAQLADSSRDEILSQLHELVPQFQHESLAAPPRERRRAA